jgi:hypothetical protein
MTKEKVQNKVQTIQWLTLSVLYFVLFLWPFDCLYFMLYFFFCHWIVCTLFCTFSFAIGLPVLYFVLFNEKVQNKVQTVQKTKEKVLNKVQTIQWLKKKYKIKDRQCTGQSLDCLYFILYFFVSHWIVCTLFCTFSLVIGLFVLYFVLFR